MHLSIHSIPFRKCLVALGSAVVLPIVAAARNRLGLAEMEYPLDRSVALCFLAIPFAWALAGVLTPTGGDGNVRGINRFGVAVASWLFATHFLSTLVGSFALGLALGSAIMAILGAPCLLRNCFRDHSRATSFPSTNTLGLGLIALLAMALIQPTIWATDYHDKINMGPQGHFAYMNQLANSLHYPPVDMVFPHMPRHYHFGVHLPIVLCMAAFGMRVDSATDLVELLTWGWIAMLFASLAWVIWGGRRGPALVAGIAAGLAGSFTLFATPDAGGYLRIGGQMILPPFASTFFQMPFSLGTALALTASGLFLESEKWNETGRGAAALAVVLCTLSFVNTTLFLASIGAMAGTLFCRLALSCRRGHIIQNRYWWQLLALGLAAMAFVCLNSLWGNIISPGSSRIVFAPTGFAGTASLSALYAMEIFGPMLVAFLALLAAPRLLGLPARFELQTLYLIFLVTGSVAVFNLFRFTQSWDIIKFGTVAHIYLGLLATGWCGHVLSSRRPALMVAGLCGLLLVCWSPASSMLLTAKKLYLENGGGLGNTFRQSPTVRDPAPGWKEMLRFIRTQLTAQEVVLSDPDLESRLALEAGIPQFTPTGWEVTFGIPASRIARRIELAQAMPSSAALYEAEGVRMVVSASPDRGVGRLLEAWIASGEAVELARFGTFTVGALRHSIANVDAVGDRP